MTLLHITPYCPTYALTGALKQSIKKPVPGFAGVGKEIRLASEGQMTQDERNMFDLSGFYAPNNRHGLSPQDVHYGVLRSWALHALMPQFTPLTSKAAPVETYFVLCQKYSREPGLSALSRALSLPAKTAFSQVDDVLVRLTRYLDDTQQVAADKRYDWDQAIAAQTGLPMNAGYLRQVEAMRRIPREVMRALLEAEKERFQAARSRLNAMRSEALADLNTLGVKRPGRLLNKLDRIRVF